MKIKEKTYDCLEEIRKSRERIGNDLKGKSMQQILAYFKERQEKNAAENKI